LKVKEAINNRRAYRSLDHLEITNDTIYDLARCAQLSASCFNNQPWRYLFVYDSKILKNMHEVLSSGNEWAKKASMIIVVFSKKDDDCVIRDREYYLFDTGMATANLILRATELDFIAHPIAGFSPKKTREVLKIPDKYQIITLVIVGKHSKTINPVLSEKQIKNENKRPGRLQFDKFMYINKFQEK